MLRALNRFWRLLGTGFSFLCFGIGGFFLSVVIFPLVHLFSRDRARAQRRCRFLVHKSFALFIWLMKSLGVLDYRFTGAELLQGGGKLVVANHPSLIDVVFIVSRIPDAYCIVKKAAWKNPVMFGVMRATGFIANDEGESLVQGCVELLRAGRTLVLFPEGTRTVPGKPPHFQRGATIIALTADVSFTPVYISCKPTTLTKGEKWYEIPSRQPLFQLKVGSAFKLVRSTQGERVSPILARRQTTKLQEHFFDKCEEYYGDSNAEFEAGASGARYRNA